nr:unnamed protein product [Digitaria exilis]
MSGAHPLARISSSSFMACLYPLLLQDGVGDDVGHAAAAEHIVEHRERVAGPAAAAEATDERVVGVRVGLHGHVRHEPPRGVELPGPAVARHHGVVGHDVGDARAQHAPRVGGPAQRAELLDERGAGPRRGARGWVVPREGVDEADGLLDVPEAD